MPFLFGGLAVLPVAWPDLARIGDLGASGKVWLGLVYMVFLATCAGYALSTWAVQRSSPALVAACTTLQPFLAAALAVVFLNERLGWEELLGFALIAGGLALVTRARETGGAEPIAAPDATVPPPARQA